MDVYVQDKLASAYATGLSIVVVPGENGDEDIE